MINVCKRKVVGNINTIHAGNNHLQHLSNSNPYQKKTQINQTNRNTIMVTAAQQTYNFVVIGRNSEAQNVLNKHQSSRNTNSFRGSGKSSCGSPRGKDHVSLQIGLLVPLAWTAIDFIEMLCGANYPRQTVKGAHSVAGDVTSASANLEKQTSHDSTQLLAFSCGVEGTL